MAINNKKQAILLPIIFSLLIIAGIFIGINLKNNRNLNADKIFIYPRNYNKLNEIIDLINESYVDTFKKDSLIEIIIPELLSKLDPHSVYIPFSEIQEMNEPLEGNFEGIGIQFNMINDTATVVTLISGGPAEKVGIMAGDRIVEISDSNVAGKKIPSNDIVKMLKGPKGTKVEVKILRQGIKDKIKFEIIRDIIPLNSIDIAYLIKPDIGYIKISKFARTTHDEFIKAIHDLKIDKNKKLIIDLRGNGGGYLEAATSIANEFLPAGKLIVYTMGRTQPRRDVISNKNGICVNNEVVILIDEWSASASEILAGAIQDNDRGTIIGRRSFGKGLVQQPIKLADGSEIRLTIARYYTPSGRCIQKTYKNGLEDYYKELEKRYENGELEIKDSIHFSDTTKYYTASGRVVYGGGGILPDIFVPLETSYFTEYYKNIVANGLIYRFAWDYADKNRSQLTKFNNYITINSYLEKQNILEKFIQYAEKQRVKKNKKEIEISKNIINTQLKAYIARNIIDDKGFYPILSETDNTLKEAIKLLEKK